MGALSSAAQTVLVTHLLRVDFQQVCRKQDVFSFFRDTLVWAPQRSESCTLQWDVIKYLEYYIQGGLRLGDRLVIIYWY